MKAADYCVFQLLRRRFNDLFQGPHDVTGLGPSRPLHKWPPVKSAPEVSHLSCLSRRVLGTPKGTRSKRR